MSILQVRDKDGNFVPIHAIRGNDGKSAYDLAKEGGYAGTEQEFIALLNMLPQIMVNVTALDENEDINEKHLINFNNPHNVTAAQVGAVAEAYYASADLNTELQSGGNKITVCSYNAETLNTPYKEGVTVFAHGMVITNSHTSQYGTQLCMPSGDKHTFIRALSKQGVTPWEQVADMSEVNELKARLEAAEAQQTKIASGTYKGTGTHGVDNKNTLTFPFVPKLVFISTPSTIASGTDYAEYYATATLVSGSLRGFVSKSTEKSTSNNDIPLILSWEGNTLAWYYINTSTTSTGMTAAKQLNYAGAVYNWVAIG